MNQASLNKATSVLRRLFVASPQRGEMFIAWRFSLYSEAPLGAQSLLLLSAKVLLPGFAPNGARSLGVRLVTINISLLWSENEFDAIRTPFVSRSVFSKRRKSGPKLNRKRL
jgi:hypothetical protein